MSRTSTRTLAWSLLALLTLSAVPAAQAIEGGVIIPQVDPQPDEGYVDVWYHNCPVLGNQPCSHHYVGRVTIPCLDPEAGATPRTGAIDYHLQAECDTPIDGTINLPCVAPVVEPDVSYPTYGGRFGNCGTTVERHECVQPGYATEYYSNTERHIIRWCGQDWIYQDICTQPVETYNNGQRRYVEIHRHDDCWRDTACLVTEISTESLRAGNCPNGVVVPVPCHTLVVQPDTTGPDYGGTFGICTTTVPVQQCVAPVVEPDVSYPTYGGRFGNCGTTVERHECVQPGYATEYYSNTERHIIRWCGQDWIYQDICTQPVETYNNGQRRYVEIHRHDDCWRDTACLVTEVSATGVRAGSCPNGVHVPVCTDTSGTGVTNEAGGRRVRVVHCGTTLVNHLVEDPSADAPCFYAGSEPGNTAYLRVWLSCDWSNPISPQPHGDPIFQTSRVPP